MRYNNSFRFNFIDGLKCSVSVQYPNRKIYETADFDRKGFRFVCFERLTIMIAMIIRNEI